MNQISDQEWQQLQAHIEGFWGQTLTNDVQRIEYKPLFIALLECRPNVIRTNPRKQAI
jgi:hypothetical protein